MKTIGSSAFLRCEQFTKAIIPDAVTSLGARAFAGCKNLTEATVGKGVTQLPDELFYAHNELQNTFNCSKLTSVTLPATLTRIGNGTFRECTALQSIALPASLHDVGNEAFESCTSLVLNTLPDGVTAVRHGAFKNCSAITEFTLPESVSTLQSQAFAGCSNLRTLHLSKNLNDIADSICYNDALLNAVNLGDVKNTTRIGEAAFQFCLSLKEVTIPQNVTEIWYQSFANDVALSRVHFKTPKVPAIAPTAEVTVTGDDLYEKPKTITMYHSFYHIANPATFIVPDVAVDAFKQLDLSDTEVMINIVGESASTGISSVNNDSQQVKQRFSIGGSRLNAPAHGITIERLSDGSARKVLRK